MSVRVPAHLWISACLSLCSQKGIAAYVAARGDADSGTVLLRITDRDGRTRLLNQTRLISGALGWMEAFKNGPVDPPDAIAYIEKARARDPDLWVVEVEAADENNPFLTLEPSSLR
jgi:hypothetical protein